MQIIAVKTVLYQKLGLSIEEITTIPNNVGNIADFFKERDLSSEEITTITDDIEKTSKFFQEISLRYGFTWLEAAGRNVTRKLTDGQLIESIVIAKEKGLEEEILSSVLNIFRLTVTDQVIKRIIESLMWMLLGIGRPMPIFH